MKENESIQQGARIRVISGFFKGKEATIVRRSLMNPKAYRVQIGEFPNAGFTSLLYTEFEVIS
jgi:hypothetical protein